MEKDKNYKPLCETQKLALGHIFETTYLTMKSTGQTIVLGEIYGDPTCGLISIDDKWCIVGGSTLLLWTQTEIVRIDDEDFFGTYDFKQMSNQKIELLIDPWSDNSSIWEFDIKTKDKRKIKDFNAYKNKEYTSTIVW